MTSSLTALLARITLFRDLPPVELERVAGICREHLYARDETLFSLGDPGDRLYLISQGWVKITRVSPDGREKTLAILGEGDCLGEMALLDGAPRSATATTLSSCTVYCLEQARFRELLDANPGVTHQLLIVLTRRLREADAQIEESTFQDAHGKVAAALLRLWRTLGVVEAAGTRIPLRLTHQELADLAGTTRETTSRILAELHDQGIIDVRGGHLVIVHPQGLERMER